MQCSGATIGPCPSSSSNQRPAPSKWLSEEGDLEVFALDGSDRARRMIGQLVENEADLAAVLEELGLIDREAAFYAHEIWIRVSPNTPTGWRGKLRKRRGREEYPAGNAWVGGGDGGGEFDFSFDFGGDGGGD